MINPQRGMLSAGETKLFESGFRGLAALCLSGSYRHGFGLPFGLFVQLPARTRALQIVRKRQRAWAVGQVVGRMMGA